MIAAIPEDKPLTKPEDDPIDATDGDPLVQVPPADASVSVSLKPWQIGDAPPIIAGNGLTVKGDVI